MENAIHLKHMNPIVSVVMSVYNDSKYISDSVESILNQDLYESEFIIVDDGSTDESLQVIEEYAKSDSRIRIIRNSNNCGLAASLNNAISVARGEYVARMDSDDISLTYRLRSQFEFMKRNKDIMLVGSSVYRINKDGIVMCETRANTDHVCLKKWVISGGIPCMHPTWFFRRSLFHDINGYRILPAAQDYDFLARVVYKGHKISNVSVPLLCQRLHGGMVSAKSNICQLKIASYVKKAGKRNFIFEDRYFTEDIIKRIVKTPKILHLLHKIALVLVMKSIETRKDKKLLSCVLYIAAMLCSPYRFYYVMNSFVRQVFCKIRR